MRREREAGPLNRFNPEEQASAGRRVFLGEDWLPSSWDPHLPRQEGLAGTSSPDSTLLRSPEFLSQG